MAPLTYFQRLYNYKELSSLYMKFIRVYDATPKYAELYPSSKYWPIFKWPYTNLKFVACFLQESDTNCKVLPFIKISKALYFKVQTVVKTDFLLF